MQELFGFPELKDTLLLWLPPLRKSWFFIYWIVLGLFLCGFASLFCIHVFISVRAPGILRPFNERAEIKSTASGIIDSLYYAEGNRVETNDLLMTIRDPGLTEKKRLNEMEIRIRKEFIHDLELLLDSTRISQNRISALITPLYRQKALKFLFSAREQQLNLFKARHDFQLNATLARDKIISAKEFYDIQMQEQKATSSLESFHREQMAAWQADLIKYKLELKEFLSRLEELNRLYESYHIRIPIGGCLQELNGRYPGSSIQAGETICSVSPGGYLIGECYVGTKDIGMLKPGQPVRFQVDAFNYNYFGVITGSILTIEDDFILLDRNPVFKVRCLLDQQKIQLRNGYLGILKKGMRIQARFITGKRSLAQLLYDSIDDWFDPSQ